MQRCRESIFTGCAAAELDAGTSTPIPTKSALSKQVNNIDALFFENKGECDIPAAVNY